MRIYTQAEMDASPSRADWFRRATEGGRRGPLLILWMLVVGLAGGYGCSVLPPMAEAAAGAATGGWVSVAVSLGVTMLAAALLVAPYPLIMRPYRPRRTLLWLRRFHMTDRKWFPIEKALNESRSFVATPLTIRDPRMAADRSAGSPVVAALRVIRYVLMLPAVFTVLVAGLIALSVIFPNQIGSGSAFVITGDDADAAASWIAVGVFAVIGALILALFLFLSLTVWRALRAMEDRFGYVTLPKAERGAVGKLDRFFGQVASGHHAPGRMRIFRTHDQSWQAVVKRAIARADLVLLDISHLTDNIEWEVEQVFTAHAPETIIVALQRSEETGEVDPATLTRLKQIAQQIAGADAFSRVQLLDYPAHREADLGGSVRKVSDAIRERIFDALDRSAATA